MLKSESIRYPVYRPSLRGKELEYVTDCIRSTWISSKGKYIQAFEEAFARFSGVPHAASVSNGTVALHAALLAVGIGPGDEVIVPTLTYIASVNAIRYCGATPVFVDSLESDWQMDPEAVRNSITSRTKAILVVHLYGHPCDMDALMDLARENRLLVVEDCAEAIGTKFRGQNVGTFGEVASFSFFGNKTITTGEGGMVITRDEEIHDRVVRIKGQGLAKNCEYWHDIVGYNYRMTNICAAIGLAQLENAEEVIEQKKRIARWYREGLEGTVYRTNYTNDPGVDHSYWMFSVLAPDPPHRDALRRHLREYGIETRPLFPPIHHMPMYFREGLSFPVADRLSGRGINLPSYPELNEGDVKEITKTIRSFGL